MEQLIQQYIPDIQAFAQSKGLNEQDYIQLIEELKGLDEQSFRGVIKNIQKALGGNSQQPMQQAPQQVEEEMMMQYGGDATFVQKAQKIPFDKTFGLKPKYDFGLYSQYQYEKPINQQDSLEYRNYFERSKGKTQEELAKEIKILQQTVYGNEGVDKLSYFKKLQALKDLKKQSSFQYGGIPVDEDGLYAYPNSPVVVPTRGTGHIQTHGIDYPVEAYDADNGEFLHTMQPNQEYDFDADNILEIPKGKFGISKMQAGGNKGVNYFSNNFNNDEVRDIMLERRLEREQIAKGEKQALEDLKKLKKSKNPKGKIEKTFGKNETKAFFDELEDFTEEQIDDVIKRGDESKHSGKFKKILRGKGNILLNLFEASPLAQAFIQESSFSPTQTKPNEKQITSKTAFNLRKQGYNIPDSMIEGNKNTLITPIKSNIQNTPITNYFQPNSQPLPNNFNSNLTESTSQHSGNTPVEAIGNPNLRVGDRVDTVGGKPVKDFGISNKTDKFGFVSQLKGEKTSKQDNINDYKTWVKDWSTKIDGFDKLPYANQQMVAMQWVKAQRPDVYEGLRKQWEAKGYNKNGKGFEGFLNDGMYANITSSLRPSTLTNNEEPVPNFVDANLPVESGNSQPTKYTGTIDNTPIALPQESKFSFEDAVNPADAIIGKLDNRDMSGRYLSNMMLRNNEIKLPYFQQVDLKTPQLYQQDITPYINNLYTGYNSAAQNIDMNSAVGQAQALQLNANLDKSINDVSGTVYNQNLKAAIDWENQLTGIYNQQSQLDNQNRAAYSDGVDQVRTNKQNVDNQIDALAYEHKMKQIQNKNQMTLSTLLHPDFYTTDEGNGQMVLKRKYNKAPTANSTPTNTNPSIEAERDFWKDLALKNSKTKAAKYGIGKKKAC